MLAQPEIDEEMKHISERERSVDKMSLTHSLLASSCVSYVWAGWHLNCSGPCQSMAPSPLRLSTGLPTHEELYMVKKIKKLKNPHSNLGRELSDSARSERRQKGLRAESQVTGDGDLQCCFIWSNLSGIAQSFQKAPTNHSSWVWCPFARAFWKKLVVIFTSEKVATQKADYEETSSGISIPVF